MRNAHNKHPQGGYHDRYEAAGELFNTVALLRAKAAYDESVERGGKNAIKRGTRRARMIYPWFGFPLYPERELS